MKASLAIPERIGQGQSLISLLEASAYAPDGDFSSDSEDEDSSEEPTPHSSDPELPSFSHHVYEPENKDHNANPSRGSHINISSVNELERVKKLVREREDLVKELTLDSMESVDAAISHAQRTNDPESFEEPELDAERTKEAKLATLVQEFGPWSDDTEEFVMQIPGALYRGVLVKGIIALTNRRLFIFAYIPPPELNKVIRNGPITIHYPGRFEKKRRVWFELKSDSLSWYKSSRKLHKPIGACRLSGAKNVLPYNPEEPKVVRVELLDGRKRHFTLDTEESAIGWRNDLEAALFTFRATADKLRLSLPLQFVYKTLIELYTSLACRVHLHFDVELCQLRRESEGAALDSASEDSGSSQQSIEFGYLQTHHDFSDLLQKYVDLAQALPICGGVAPILEIDSAARASDVEFHKEIFQDKGLAAQFVRTFALHDRPADLYLVPSCELVRSLPTWGSLVISSIFLCFWRKGIVVADVKLRIPLVDVDDAVPAKAFGFRIFGLAIRVHGSADVRVDFLSKKLRDEVIVKLKEAALAAKASKQLSISTEPSEPSSPTPSSPTSPTTAGRPYFMRPLRGSFEAHPDHTKVLGLNIVEDVVIPAGAAKAPFTIIGTLGRRTVTAQHFVCMAIGSRGDVQPYIALGLELMKDGNRVTIASHPEYRAWVEGYGIGYREIGGDPAALMKLSVEHKMFSPGFFRESLGHFRHWLDTLFEECWAAAQEADVLIESPSTMAGIHVAEALGIPYFRAFTMPWTSTATYPHAFGASTELGATYNLLSYSIFDSVMWKATAGQVNRFRKNILHLAPTSLHKMGQSRVPFIYNFSSAVLPKPNDWKDHIFISGYWFLDDPPNKVWDPPAGLLEFIQKARNDGKAVVYVGFGSIVVPDSAAVTKAVVKAVIDADVRVILSKGWSDRLDKVKEEVELPEEIFSVLSIAHDRLFPLIDAACHHGGAGTTGASLRAGLPTLIHPFFGDQYLWASRVQKLGCGVRVETLSARDLSTAFKIATTDRIMKEKAEDIGERIRAEHGPRAAIDFITDHIHLAQERADIRAAKARREKIGVSRVTTIVRSVNPTRSCSPKRASTLPILPTFPRHTDSTLSTSSAQTME